MYTVQQGLVGIKHRFYNRNQIIKVRFGAMLRPYPENHPWALCTLLYSVQCTVYGSYWSKDNICFPLGLRLYTYTFIMCLEIDVSGYDITC